MRGGQSYDVIFLGSGLSALLAAALLARRGYYVLVLDELETNDPVIRRYSKGNFSYLQGPSLFLGFERDGLYDRIFLELGLSLSALKREGVLFSRSDDPFQVILPNHRINFYNDPRELFEELGREFPDHRLELKKFLIELDEWDGVLNPFLHSYAKPAATGINDYLLKLRDSVKIKSMIRSLKRQSMQELLKPFSHDPELKRVFEMFFLLFTNESLEEASAFDLLVLISALLKEVVILHGGIPALTELLLKTIRKYQGDVIFAQSISEITIHRKRVVSIRADKDEIPVQGQCIVNLSMERLPGEKQKTSFIAFYYFIPKELIPPPMKDFLLLNPDLGKAPRRDNLQYYIVSDPREPWNDPKDMRALQVILQIEERDPLEDDDIEELKKGIQDQMNELVPFSPNCLEYFGFEQWSTNPKAYLSAIDDRVLARPKKGPSHGNGLSYVTFPIRNLYLLPDHGHWPVGRLWQARSAKDLVDHIMKV